MQMGKMLWLMAGLMLVLIGCKKEEGLDLATNTEVTGRALRFGTLMPAVDGPLKIEVYELEESIRSAEPPTRRLLQTINTDSDGRFSFKLEAQRNPRFRYYAQLATAVEQHFDPTNFPFYFDAGRVQSLTLYHYPHAWLKVKARMLNPGVGHHLNLTFPNGSDYDHWGLGEFETVELLTGNAVHQITASLTRQGNDDPVVLTFFKYLPAFDTVEHVLEY